MDPILGLDPGVMRTDRAEARPTAKIRLAVLVASRPGRVERMGTAGDRREPRHAGMVLGRCLERPGDSVEDAGLGRHDVDAVVDALPLVADGEEQLVALYRASQVKAELGAGVVRDKEGRGVRGPTLPLDQVERLERVGLPIAEDGAVEFVCAAMRYSG